MLTLTSIGLFLAILKFQTGNIIGSIITFYMISTVGSPAAAQIRAGLSGAHFLSASAGQLPSTRIARVRNRLRSSQQNRDRGNWGAFVVVSPGRQVRNPD
jgi:hypothetical protein